VFSNELKQTTVIHIGRSAQMHLPLFSRVLHLVKASPPVAAPGAPAELRDSKEAAPRPQ
jgi:hypothetical protein